MTTLQPSVSSVTGMDNMAMRLVNLCEKLHPERTAKAPTFILRKEANHIVIKGEKYIKGILQTILENNGSVSNSINSWILFCLGITDEEPSGNLVISIGSPPDIDWDCAERDRIIEYLEERYGPDRVARVGSLNFLRTKSAIKDIGRVLGKEYKFIEDLTNLVPPAVAGLWESLEQECEVEPKLLDPKYADIIEPIKKLWGVVRSYGTHAGGVAIAPGPINRFVPLYKDKDGNPVSQFDWRDLEAVGLLKFDILGLKTLEVIQLCLKHVSNRGITVDLENLEDGDKAAYDEIKSGSLDGIFQLGGSEGIKQLTVRIAPENIEDLALVTSLFRPGPLASGMVEDAVAVRQKKKEEFYIHPILEDILKSTHCVPVYQEQVMRICTDLCGYTLPEADMMRKILGKKLKSKMKEQKPKFVAGAIVNGVLEADADQLFEQLKDYAQYLF